MDLGLKGQLVVVTGSTQGIGFAIAVAFAQQGARVVLNGRTSARTEEAKAQLIAKTRVPASTVFAVAADMSKKEDIDRFIATVDAIGPVEVLINNHGVFSFGNFFDETDDRWNEYWNINVFSQVRLSRHFLKGMLERKTGRILFSSSLVASTPIAGGIAYSLSKAAQVSLARGLSELTKGTQVTVNSVLIGPTETEGHNSLLNAAATANNVTKDDVVNGFFTSELPSYKLGRLETSDEIASVFLFLASKHGLIINGAAQRADAGSIRHL